MDRREQKKSTRLAHSGRAPTRSYGLVNPPLHRGSTVLYPSTADRAKMSIQRMEQALIYGLQGNATHHALEDLICEIEGGTRAQILPTGLAAVTAALLSFLKQGDHCLVPDSVYGPAKTFCQTVLVDYGITSTFYVPDAPVAEIEALMRLETRVVYVESPGSHTFEVQDIPAIAAMAHTHGAKVLMDNTWGVYNFHPFKHGVDVSIQALTKYVGGHSDILLGSICVNDREDLERVRSRCLALGLYASPDDCWLALRGARTLGLRLQHQAASALKVAEWLRARPEVHQVLYPALPGAPGHELWKRDFTGAASLFAIVLDGRYGAEAASAFVDALELFGIGASWGGYESLAVPAIARNLKRQIDKDYGGPLIRLHIGIEEVADLVTDLERGFAALPGAAG